MSIELTPTEKILIILLDRDEISEETQQAVFHLLREEELQMKMIVFLIRYTDITEQEVLQKLGEILKAHKGMN